jgi:hypothetical protein
MFLQLLIYYFCLMNSIKEIKSTIKKALSLHTFRAADIKIPSDAAGQPNRSGTHFTDVNHMREIIYLYDKIGLFKSQIITLQETSIFKYQGNSLNLLKEEATIISDNFKYILNIAKELAVILDEISPDESPDSINIKLPSNIANLNDLSHVSRELHLAISQVIFNEEINGEEKITGVENGSIWINIFLGTSAAASLIASITWSAIVILKKKRELDLFSMQVQAYGLQIANNESLVEMNKKQIDIAIEAEAEYVLSEHFKNNPEDKIERIKNSIKIVSEIIDKGAEIHPSITSPEPLSNLFPSMKNLIAVESKVKKITQSN